MRVSRTGRAIIAASLILIAVVAVVAISVLLALGRDEGGSIEWRDPLGLVAPDEVVPGLALYPLAGAAEVETIDAGMDTGELMTAYAALVYGLELSDRQLMGRLAALGSKLVEDGKGSIAASVFQQVYDLAILSPELSDPLRAEGLQLAARGWSSAEEAGQAMIALEQVASLAQHSPYLQTAQRLAILASLEEAYRELDRRQLAENIQNQIEELEQGAPGGSGRRGGSAASVPRLVAPISSPEVGVLEEARREAAYALISGLTAGGEAGPDQLAALAQALVAEDEAKLSLYTRELSATSQPARRSEVHLLLVRWLLLKKRIAEGSFGLSIVPAWEEQRADIDALLGKAWEDLGFDYEDWATSLPDAAEILPSRYAALRSIVLAGRLGRYPGYPSQGLVQRLASLADGLVSAGHGEDLLVRARGEGSDLVFYLLSGPEPGSTP